MKSAGPERYQPRPICTAWKPSAAARTSEKRGPPAGAVVGKRAVEQHEHEERQRERDEDAEDDAESERLPAERLVHVLAQLAHDVLEHRDDHRAEEQPQGAEHEEAAHESAPHEARARPSSNTTARVFCIDDITPGRAPECEPERHEAGEAPGRGHRRDQRVELGRSAGDRSSWSAIAGTRSCRSTWLDESTCARIVATKVASGTSENSAR